MKSIDTDGLHNAIIDGAIELLPTYLPADHHHCIQGIAASMRVAAPISIPGAGVVEISESDLSVIVDQVARNVSAQHMVGAAAEEQERIKKRQPVVKKLGPLRYYRVAQGDTEYFWFGWKRRR